MLHLIKNSANNITTTNDVQNNNNTHNTSNLIIITTLTIIIRIKLMRQAGAWRGGRQRVQRGQPVADLEVVDRQLKQ